MAPTALVGKYGWKLDRDQLRRLSSGSYSIVASIGACCANRSSTINKLFGTGFATGAGPSEQTTFGVQAEAAQVNDLYVLAKPPRKLLVLDVEGSDSRDVSRAVVQQRSACFAVALADIVILCINARDIPRVEVSGARKLFDIIEDVLQLRAEKVIERSKKQLLCVVVMDFDAEQISREDTIATLMREFHALFSHIARPSGFVSTRLTDIFEFEFLTVPNERLFGAEFDAKMKEFGSRLLDPTTDEYLFSRREYENPVSAEELPRHATRVWTQLSGSSDRAGANDTEINATYHCDAIMRAVLRRYQGYQGRQWQAEVEVGNLIRNFGTQAGKAVDNALTEYERDAKRWRGTAAFDRKRSELRELMVNDLGTLYSKMVIRVRTIAYENFKRIVDRTPVTTKYEKDLAKRVQESERKFVTQVESMSLKNSGWRYETERSDLVKAMKELAHDRTQIERLQGHYVPGLRYPVNLTVHYLNPSVRPEDMLPSAIFADKSDRLITAPQRVNRDKSAKSDPARMYAHQVKNYSGLSAEARSFDVSSPF